MHNRGRHYVSIGLIHAYILQQKLYCTTETISAQRL